MSPQISRRSMLGGMLAFGWQPRHSKSPASGTLRINATPSIFKPTFEQLKHEFERRYPQISIDLRTSARDQDAQIQGTLRQALIGELPDVSFEGMKYLRMLKRRNIAVPLDTLIHNDPEWRDENYGPSLTGSTSVDGKILGASAAVSLPIIYYDVDHVTSVLGGGRLPDNWTDLSHLVSTLGQNARSGNIGAFIQHSDSSLYYMTLVASLGGSMMNRNETQVTIDNAAGLEALNIMAAFGDAGQARLDMGREQARQAFAGGAIKLLIDSSSSLTMLEKQIAGRFKLGTARLPIRANGRFCASGIAAVICTRDPVRQAAAWQYVKFVCGPEGQSIIGRSTGYLPANDVVVQRSDLLASYYASRPLVQPVVASLPYTAPWYVFPGGNAMKIDSCIIDGVGSVVSLSKTPRQAAASMKRTVEQMLPIHAT